MVSGGMDGGRPCTNEMADPTIAHLNGELNA